jgi:hypothetical protein
MLAVIDESVGLPRMIDLFWADAFKPLRKMNKMQILSEVIFKWLIATRNQFFNNWTIIR